MKRLLLSLFSASMTLLSAMELTVPYVEKTEKMFSADLPWHSGFTLLGTGAKPLADTRFKIAHNNRYLYLVIEAMEPEMGKLKAKEYPSDHPELWRNDSIEINFDPDGRGKVTGKITLDPNGRIADYIGIDDNTGNHRYVLDIGWNSGTKVLASKRLADRWCVTAAIPFGAFFDGVRENISQLRLNVGRNRTTVRESTSFAPVVTAFSGHGDPRFFPQLKLEKSDVSSCCWKVNNLSVSGKKTERGNIAFISARVQNGSSRFRVARARAVLKNRKTGKSSFSDASFPAKGKELVSLSPVIAPVEPGKYTLTLELYSTAGDLLAAHYIANTELDFQSLRIRMLEPAYRDTIYASMNLKTIRAEICLDEGVGKPLDVILSGPGGVRQKIHFSSANVVNQVSFPFVENMANGTYELKAGNVVRKLRKLPYVKGEIWFDRNNVCYSDGKPFFGFGYYGAYPEWKTRGTNVTVIVKNDWTSEKVILSWLDRCAKTGVRLMCYPYMEPNGKWELFSEENRKAGKLSQAQRESVTRFVKVSRNHPGLFGYYVADEPEGSGQNENWYEDLKKLLMELDPWHPVVITNYGPEGQRQFHTGCDLLQPDNYPNYFCDDSNNLPRSSSFTSAQTASSLRPAWEMIQSFDWGRRSMNGAHGRSPSYDELREQMWLAILGNVKGITAYVMHTWGSLSYQLRIGRNYLGPELDALKELILQNTVPVTVSPEEKTLFAGIKAKDGRFLVIAVNTSGKTKNYTFRLNGKTVSKLTVSGEQRFVSVKNGSFTDSFRPHETHIYLSDGIESDAVDHNRVREMIRQADLNRKKPGNLAAAGEMTMTQMKDYRQGIIPAGVPKITVSSEAAELYWKRDGAATWYFLQDGICETTFRDMMTWTPDKNEKIPRIDFDFGKEVTAGRICFYLYTTDVPVQLKEVRILAEKNGTFQEIARCRNSNKRFFEVKFSPVTTRKLRIELTDLDLRDRLLDEIEIYKQ